MIADGFGKPMSPTAIARLFALPMPVRRRA
jgi:hypothetical protein